MENPLRVPLASLLQPLQQSMRRRPLDSFTYRTLCSIFSHCLEFERYGGSLNPNPFPSPSDHSESKFVDPQDDSLREANEEVEKKEEVGEIAERQLEHDNPSIGLVEKNDLKKNLQSRQEELLQLPRELKHIELKEHTSNNNLKSLEEALLCDNDSYGDSVSDDLISGFVGSVGLVVDIREPETGQIDISGDNGDHKLVDGSEKASNGDKCFEIETSKENLNMHDLVDGGSDYVRLSPEREGLTKEEVCAANLIDNSVLANVGGEQVSLLEGIAHDEDFEEGQIADEFHMLEECLDEAEECKAAAEDQNSEDSEVEYDIGDKLHNPRQDEFEKIHGNERIFKAQHTIRTIDLDNTAHGNGFEANNLSLPEDGFRNWGNHNQGKSSDATDGDVPAKKRGGNKARRKEAKKRKRAQKEREQGVKRLKLQPITKPRIVKHCTFFLKGRCQQGDQCKFSHDVVPLTKSKPCTHFALGTCLKGDDCPFDHQLSKYPCHNYMASGACIRGDKCKFSHEMPAAGGSLPTPDVGRSQAPLSSDKSNVRKDPNIERAYFSMKPLTQNASSSSEIPVPPSKELSLNKSSFKPPDLTPKGVRFISFGKGSLDKTIKHPDSLHEEKHTGLKISNQDTRNSLWKHSATSNSKNTSSRLFVYSAPYGKPNSISKENNYGGDSGASSSNKLQKELSEATKILEEFLFGNV